MAISPLGFKSWLLISGFLVLLAGASLGFLAATVFNTVPATAPLPEEIVPEAPSTDGPPQYTNEAIYDLLAFDDEQRRQADQFFAVHFQDLQRLRKEREDLWLIAEGDLLGLLDEEQKVRMRELLRGIQLGDTMDRAARRGRMLRLALKLDRSQEERIYTMVLANEIRKEEYWRDYRLREASGNHVPYMAAREFFSELRADLCEKLENVFSAQQLEQYKKLDDRRMGSPRGMPRGKGGRARPRHKSPSKENQLLP